MIYVIGDSHIHEFKGNNFKHFWVGAATAYGLFNIKSRTQSRNRILDIIRNIPKGSNIIIALGEIDCRLYVYKQQMGMVRAIDETIQRVLLFCRELIELGFNTYFYNINPAVWEENIYNVQPFPTLEVRSWIYLTANRSVRLISPIQGVSILDIYDSLLGENYMLNPNYTDDGVHINETAAESFLIPEVKRVIQGGL